jgi:hypothetical protein
VKEFFVSNTIPSIQQRHRTLDAVQEGIQRRNCQKIIKTKKSVLPHILIYIDKN